MRGGCCAGPPLSEARAAQKFPLLAPALAGLAHSAHLISVEYFGDLLAVMLRMLSGPGLPVRTRLAVLRTASDILRRAMFPHAAATCCKVWKLHVQPWWPHTWHENCACSQQCVTMLPSRMLVHPVCVCMLVSRGSKREGAHGKLQ